VSYIGFFGEVLSREIHKDVLPCKGIVRLAIKKTHPNSDLNKLTYEDIYKVFKGSLKKQLESVGVEKPNIVSIKMVAALTKNQSLLTMSK